jgi:hypothetical protein
MSRTNATAHGVVLGVLLFAVVAHGAPTGGRRKLLLCRQVKHKRDLPAIARRPYTLGAAVRVAGRGVGEWLEISVAVQTVALASPWVGDRRRTLAVAARVGDALAALPASARRLIRRVQISPRPNPDDASWTRRYGRRIVAGMTASAVDGELCVYPQGLRQEREVFVRNMMHEIGHLWSGREYGVAAGKRWAAWRRAVASDPALPSSYATAALQEDAAEATALYLSTLGTAEHERYRALLPARFALLTKVLPQGNP